MRTAASAMDFLNNALTLITLLSLFLLGPTLGRALVACFDSWHNRSLPIQHLAVGICTMIAVTGMILKNGGAMETEPQVRSLVHLDPGSASGRQCERHRPGLRPTAVEKVKVERLCVSADPSHPAPTCVRRKQLPLKTGRRKPRSIPEAGSKEPRTRRCAWPLPCGSNPLEALEPASPPRFIAAIILSRTDVVLAIASPDDPGG